MAHTCSTILFHCMDFRLTGEISRWLEAEGLMGDTDIVAVAGAAKELVDGSEGARELLLKQIDISSKLHQAKRVILLHHTQCGAYAASYKFVSEEDELNKHKQDMSAAEAVIKKRFPDMEVIKMIGKMEDNEGKNVKFITID